ncbi:MAG: CPBP family intramembrane glutamic endopeptidase, partial [Candidatus Thorarchaeota archaeon]
GFLILPQYLEYVIAHRAWSVSGGVGVFAVMISSIPLTTMLEEVVFRGLTQERLSWFLGNGPAVIAATVLFALIHWAPGDPAILLIDMTAIAAGGMIYGVIYNRSRSIFAAWLAHMLSDFHGIVLLFLIFNFL